MDIKKALSDMFKKQSAKVSNEKPMDLQIRPSSNTPFDSMFNNYKPLENNLGVYRHIREAMPICNQAIDILSNLIGVPEVKAVQEKYQPFIDNFMNNVQINSLNDKGMTSYLQQMADSAFHLGGGVGEIRLTESRSRIHSLNINKTETLKFINQNGEYFYGAQSGGYMTEPVEYPELINYLAFSRREGAPWGYSLYYSLPFVTQIFTRMEKAIENSAWRQGDPLYFIVITGSANEKSGAEIKKQSDALHAQFAEAMKLKRMGQVADVSGAVMNGGSAEIRTVGSDSRNMVLEVHLRTVEEQIVAGTGIPSGLFSLSWSSRESMLEGQVDILVSKINGYRTKCENLIRQDLDMELLLNKMPGLEYTVEWPSVNLQDDVNTSEARLNNANAREKEILNIVTLVGMGVLTQEQGNEELVGKKLATGKLSNEWWQVAVKNALTAKMMKGIFYVNE